MATRTISQRIALTGSEEIRKQLAALGEWGEKAFRDIQAAAEKLQGPGRRVRPQHGPGAQARRASSGRRSTRSASKIRNFGAGVSLGLTAPLVLAAKQSVTAWNEQVDAIQKVEAALASTGGVSGQTSAGLQKMASELQGITTFGDEAVLSMQAVLLTFTNIRGQRFEQATKAILNVATALGHGPAERGAAGRQGAERPAPGHHRAQPRRHPVHATSRRPTSSRWSRWATSRAPKAIILKELETQFGGIAEAMAKTPTGQWTVAMNALGDAMEQVGAIIVPYLTQLAAVIKDLALAFQALPESTRTTIVVLAGVVAVIGPILTGIGLMVQGLGGLATGFAGIMGVVARFTGVLVVARRRLEHRRDRDARHPRARRRLA